MRAILTIVAFAFSVTAYGYCPGDWGSPAYQACMQRERHHQERMELERQRQQQQQLDSYRRANPRINPCDDPGFAAILTPTQQLALDQRCAEQQVQRGFQQLGEALSDAAIPQTQTEFLSFVHQNCSVFFYSLAEHERSRVLNGYPHATNDVKRATLQQCRERGK